MADEPIIAFGQQPCGFFPRRFLVAKIRTARRLRDEIGGRIVFFYHDSDHDSRETCTRLRNRSDGTTERFNFRFENAIQRKYSPLYAKRIVPDWKPRIERQLPKYADEGARDAFARAAADNPADFCLEVYRGMGWLDGIEVVRSSDPACRRQAVAVEDCFADVAYRGELVRARLGGDGRLWLHRGGDSWIELPPAEIEPGQISPARDARLRWMQSIIGCTHYIAGDGEKAYLKPEETPEITFVPRDAIEGADDAYAYEDATHQDSRIRSAPR